MRVSALVAGVAVVAGCSTTGPVADGAAAFQLGDLDGAIALWEGAAAGGSASPFVHFDLGNAYYTKKDFPRAITHWRIAQLKRPRDTSVSHNLAYARSELAGTPIAAGYAVPWLQVATVGELGVVGALALALASLGLWVARLRRKFVWVPPLVLLWAVGAAVGCLSLWGAYSLDHHPVAVVVDREAVVRDTAVPDADIRFRLPPGSEVLVQQRLGEYLLVETGAGRRGWIPAAAVLLVHPAGTSG